MKIINYRFYGLNGSLKCDFAAKAADYHGRVCEIRNEVAKSTIHKEIL